jgi:hypothetical protein
MTTAEPVAASRRAERGRDAVRIPVQAKLRVGAVDDPLEREADEIADRILGMAPAPVATLRRCPGGCPHDQDLLRPATTLQRCPGGCSCDEEEPLLRVADGPVASLGVDAERDLDGQRRGGGPLAPPARAFFEPRFGVSLAGVRVHTDADAGRLTRQVQARAFTVGRHVFFGPGEYRPGTTAGRRLLAHELAHTLQQAQGRPARTVQRACGPTAIGAPEGCEDAQGDIFGTPFRFNMGCDTFVVAQGDLADQRSLLLEAATDLAGATVNVHGFASADGDPVFNRHLSCQRALVAADLLRSAGVTVDRLYAHGATPGPVADRRSVVVDPVTGPAPEPVPEPEPAPGQEPGPGATGACSWTEFIGPVLGEPPNFLTDFAECFCLGAKLTDMVEDLIALLPVIGQVAGQKQVQRVITVTDCACNLWDWLQLLYAVGTSPGPCFALSNITGGEAMRLASLGGLILADLGSEEIAAVFSVPISAWLGLLIDALLVSGGAGAGAAAGTPAGPPGQAAGGFTAAAVSKAVAEAIKGIMNAAIKLVVELLVDVGTQMLQSRITHGTPFPLDACQACLRRLPALAGLGDQSWWCDALNERIPEAGGIIREPAWHGD